MHIYIALIYLSKKQESNRPILTLKDFSRGMPLSVQRKVQMLCEGHTLAGKARWLYPNLSLTCLHFVQALQSHLKVDKCEHN